MKLDLGCGSRKPEGYIGVDIKDGLGVNLVADLNKGIPLPDNFAEEVRAHHILEHLDNDKRIFIMGEIWRVLRQEGILDVVVPSTDGRGAFQDPTHKSFWNENSFLYFTEDNLRNTYGIQARFEVLELKTVVNDQWKIATVVGKLRACK